jgi:hypothetical protein
MKDDKDKHASRTGAVMKNPTKNPTKNPGKNPGKNPRQDRLKQALRENLKRRKSQARGRSDVTTAPSDAADASPHDISEKKPGE